MQARNRATQIVNDSPPLRPLWHRGTLSSRTRHSAAGRSERAPLRLLVAGGGSGGHVFPALAVAKEWMSRGPDREAIFVGTERGLENRLVPEAGFKLEHIRSAGLKGMSGAKLLRNLSTLPAAFLDSLAILRRYNFNAAFGVGGYAAGPVILTAALKRMPVVIFEPNAEPGFTNRVLARFATRVATGYSELAEHFGKKAIATGSPVRADFHFAPLRRLDPPCRILITGGSQGAHALNAAVQEALPQLAARRSELIIAHQTGPRDFDDVRATYAQYEFTAQVKPFFTDMPERIAWADLVVCRAGQITIAELAAVGRPAIFVPFAAATDSHQLRNAETLERAGAAQIVQEGEASGARLAGEILSALNSPEILRQRANQIHKFARPNATKEIVDLIEQVQRP